MQTCALCALVFSIPTVLRHMLQARLETPSYLSRLGAVWLGFFALVAGPIAFQTFDPSKQVQQQLCPSCHLFSCSLFGLCQADTLFLLCKANTLLLLCQANTTRLPQHTTCSAPHHHVICSCIGSLHLLLSQDAEFRDAEMQCESRSHDDVDSSILCCMLWSIM